MVIETTAAVGSPPPSPFALWILTDSVDYPSREFDEFVRP